MNIEQKIADELSVKLQQVASVVALLNEGSSVPFIARYRKEATGGLDDTQLRHLETRLTYMRELQERRDSIVKAIDAQRLLQAAEPSDCTKILCALPGASQCL